MIEPQVEHGGASSWFCMAANAARDGAGLAAAAPPGATSGSVACVTASSAIAATGFDDRIRLAGEADEEDLPRWYDGADGFVLASRHEGYGMSLAEALMHGLPVVATRAGAIAAKIRERAEETPGSS